ncbi:enoyl-CoA hydratase/isomerase family protein [Geodermatophilus sp. DF01-2]|uniref:enoyl-CoA hydratase/isomerase family protein n=1 Tax=Geodermatophilus sp. DF01-2 TaxID=2559610 RepID=UPI0010734783|nr:enoyl-CoA hydratase/isomerase family protein [Geodermatophilus sp. DF01_2]TFV63795.1 enoyl-CoA hydratase/isomerase family protein [Geodermatophilus sp. DF01_2]
MTAGAASSEAPAVLVEEHRTVRLLRLNRPERRNALDLDDRIAFLEQLRRAADDPGCRAVVLTGAGAVFSAGGDIRSMSPDPEVAHRRLQLVNEIARHMVTTATPIVSAVEGGAFGLGLSLACASDLVVAGSSARFVASFAKIGLVADTGLFYTLPRRVGAGRARELMLTARTVSAQEAHRIGLVDAVVEDGSAVEQALAMAQELAAASPAATAGLKRILAQDDQSLEAVLAAEEQVQVELLAGPDFEEGRAAFLGRRRPVFPSTNRT